MDRPEHPASHGRPNPAAWVRRWSPLVLPGARVLDVACGSGRHVHWFAQLGCRVTGVDRDAAAIRPLSDIAELVVADIETEPWPFGDRRFDAVVVTNYLWRGLLPTLVACVGDGGVLIYETFAAGNETIGRPANPAFLLRPGELLAVAADLHIVAFEDGFEAATKDSPARFVQRIVAVRELRAAPGPVRYPLRMERPAGQVKSADSQEPA